MKHNHVHMYCESTTSTDQPAPALHLSRESISCHLWGWIGLVGLASCPVDRFNISDTSIMLRHSPPSLSLPLPRLNCHKRRAFPVATTMTLGYIFCEVKFWSYTCAENCNSSVLGLFWKCCRIPSVGWLLSPPIKPIRVAPTDWIVDIRTTERREKEKKFFYF